MARDEQVELAAADPEATGSFYPIPETPAQGPMQQHPFELVEMGGQVFGLKVLPIGARGGLLRLWQLPQQVPSHQTIPEPPEIAGTGQAAQGTLHVVERARDALLGRQRRQAGLDGARILVQAVDPKAQAPAADMGDGLCLRRKVGSKNSSWILAEPVYEFSGFCPLGIIETLHMPTLRQHPSQGAHAAAQGTKYPDGFTPCHQGIQAGAPMGKAWQVLQWDHGVNRLRASNRGYPA